MKRLIAAAAASIALVTSLAGCSGSGGNTVQGPAPTTSQSEAKSETPTPTQAQSLSAPLGGSVTFPSGVKVTVSAPEVVPGGQFAYGAVEGNITLFTLTVTNGSKEPVNAALMAFPKATYGAAGTEAQRANNDKVGAGSLSTVLPGETQTVQVGYGIPQAELGSVRLEVMSPNFSDFPAIFKG